MKQNCKQSAVMMYDQQEILLDVENPILVDSSFSVLKNNSYAHCYAAYIEIWKPLI